MITGKATGNVFDGDVMVDNTILHGVAEKSRIGFLSLFEHYGSIHVTLPPLIQ